MHNCTQENKVNDFSPFHPISIETLSPLSLDFYQLGFRWGRFLFPFLRASPPLPLSLSPSLPLSIPQPFCFGFSFLILYLLSGEILLDYLMGVSSYLPNDVVDFVGVEFQVGATARSHWIH